MKTAIQELKKYLEQQLKLHINNEIKYTTEEALVDAIQVCQNAINTKEKQQIINSYADGYSDSDNSFELNKDYYNEIFKNQ